MNAGSPDSDLATAASAIAGVHIGRLPLTMAAASLVLTCSLLVPQALRTAHWRSGLAIMRARRSVAAWQPVRAIAVSLSIGYLVGEKRTNTWFRLGPCTCQQVLFGHIHVGWALRTPHRYARDLEVL